MSPVVMCDCCGERPATHTTVYTGMDTAVCDKCAQRDPLDDWEDAASDAPRCDACDKPIVVQAIYNDMGAALHVECWQESVEGQAYLAARRSFHKSFAGSR